MIRGMGMIICISLLVLEYETLGKLFSLWVKRGNNVGWKGPRAASALRPCSRL